MTLRPLPSLTPILDQFDAFLLDQYGVIHDGSHSFFAINHTLKALKDAKKSIIMISNSGRSAQKNQQLMEKLSLSTHLIDHIFTSGDATIPILQKLSERFSSTPRCFLLTNEDPDLSSCSVSLTSDPLNTDIVFLAGIDRYPSTYIHDLLPQFLKNKAVMLCANPDIQGLTSGGATREAPGHIALHYEKIGGEVIRVGKPDPAIFKLALDLNPHISPQRTLMIGDSLAHDILGGQLASIPTLLVASGIHKQELGLSHFNPRFAPQPYDHQNLHLSTLALCQKQRTPPPNFVAPLFIL